jgi:ABC-type transport system involved in cytochrome c biogenesis permease subunit
LFAFILYNISFFVYVIALTGRRWSKRESDTHLRIWGGRAFALSLLGLTLHAAFFFTRWYAAGHIPVSNMFEFMTFLSMMITAAFIVVHLIFRKPILGAFAMPVAIIILGYAAVFPREIQPLIPALQSYWLYIHVTLAATGEAFFAVGFAAGLMYLLRTVDFAGTGRKDIKAQKWVEFTLFVVIMLAAFIAMVFIFSGFGYEAELTREMTRVNELRQEYKQTDTFVYAFPPLVGPYNYQIVQFDEFLGMNAPLLVLPEWLNIINPKKLTTLIWSIIGGLILFMLLRLIARKPLGAAISPVMNGIDPEDLDEISYRAIAIGFPVFTLGALIFAAIWAHEEWGRFWAFDPKETWALITWLFYTAYLHLRLSRGWQGEKSAWMAVLGFLVVMFTLVGVNLVIAGLHAYAGV